MITIEYMPPSMMRYDTLGDWYFEGDHLQIDVSNALADPDAMFLVAIHELIEAYLCKKRGITTEQVDYFDNLHEETGLVMEPGDHPDAPYRREHRFAMMIEHLVAFELGMADYGTIK